MFLRIEKGSSTPISRQILEQITAHCASGSLQAGDRMPSVRELARTLTVNQNTILRIYDRLAADGVLEVRHGEGTFVAGTAKKRQLDRQRKQLHDELRLLIQRGLLLGLNADELRSQVEAHLEEVAAAMQVTQGPSS